jgi:low temperature requirement protein LtrA
LFSSVWWAWDGFTFYANRFDTDDVVYRLAKLGAMLAVAGLAASASDATGSPAGQFAFLSCRHPDGAGRPLSACL